MFANRAFGSVCYVEVLTADLAALIAYTRAINPVNNSSHCSSASAAISSEKVPMHARDRAHLNIGVNIFRLINVGSRTLDTEDVFNGNGDFVATAGMRTNSFRRSICPSGIPFPVRRGSRCRHRPPLQILKNGSHLLFPT